MLTFLLSAFAVSKPGRAAVGRIVRLLGQSDGKGGDVEQRARSRHGWKDSVADWVMRGRITRYDSNGMATRAEEVTFYRGYPDRLRVELNSSRGNEVSGFDGEKAWKAGKDNLSDPEARDVRALLRIWPDRLFIGRASGFRYREAGQRTFDKHAGLTATPGADPDASLVFDQIEVIDGIGPARQGRGPDDSRRIYYYVSRDDSLVASIRWLEPDNPSKAEDPQTDRLEVGADFSRYTQVQEIYWPFEITHWQGGKVDFRITLDEIKLNQHVPESIFKPSK